MVMDEQEKFNETPLPEKEEFCTKLNMEDITDSDYMYTKRVCKEFEIKKQLNIMIYILKAMHYFQLMFLKTLEKCL